MLASLLLVGCPKHLTPTPEGTTFVDWKGTGVGTKHITKHLLLRSALGRVADVDLHLSGTDATVTAMRVSLMKNYEDWTMTANVDVISVVADSPMALIYVSASHTGPWTVRGNTYGSSGMLEMRQGFVLSGRFKVPIPPCAAPLGDVRENGGELCER